MPATALLHTTWLDPLENSAIALRLRDREAREIPARDGCAHIPASELPERVFELPPRGAAIDIVDRGEDSRAAARYLEQAGRSPRIGSGMPAERNSPNLDAARRDAPEVDAGARGVGDPSPCNNPKGNSRTAYRLWTPTPILEQIAPDLPRGRALDLGCGVGRDAVYLAAAGWEVTAIDALPDALDRARKLLSRYAPDCIDRVRWVAQNLRDENKARLRDEIRAADLIVMARYAERVVLEEVLSESRHGAILAVSELTREHSVRFARRTAPTAFNMEDAVRSGAAWQITRRSELSTTDSCTLQFAARKA